MRDEDVLIEIGVAWPLRPASLPPKPVSGPSSSMCDRHYLDAMRRLAKDDREGESAEEIAASPAQVGRPLASSPFNLSNRRVELGHEGAGRFGVAQLVPFSRGARFADCSAGWSQIGSAGTTGRGSGAGPQTMAPE